MHRHLGRTASTAAAVFFSFSAGVLLVGYLFIGLVCIGQTSCFPTLSSLLLFLATTTEAVVVASGPLKATILTRALVQALGFNCYLGTTTAFPTALGLANLSTPEAMCMSNAVYRWGRSLITMHILALVPPLG